MGGQPTPPIEFRHVIVGDDQSFRGLDPGEREAIALAEALRADALIMDDRAGRREAERQGLRVIGTLRVLYDAAETGLLSLAEALEALQRSGSLSTDACRKNSSGGTQRRLQETINEEYPVVAGALSLHSMLLFKGRQRCSHEVKKQTRVPEDMSRRGVGGRGRRHGRFDDD